MKRRTAMVAGSSAILIALLVGLNHRSGPASSHLPNAHPGAAKEREHEGFVRGQPHHSHAAVAARNPVLASGEFAALAGQIAVLRSLPFNQPRSWTHRLAIEDALVRMKELGIRSASELPAGILPDHLGFLGQERRAEVEPLVATVADQISNLEFDVLGRAMESHEVDDLRSLEGKLEDTLEKVLTPQEMAAWAARNTWESQVLRELPIELGPEQFEAVAMIEHRFQAQASSLDLARRDGIEQLARLGAWREQALGEALGHETSARLAKVRQPGYAAMMEAGLAKGFDATKAEFLWSLQRWTEDSVLQLADGNWNQLTELQEEVRETARQHLISTLGESAANAWMKSDAGSLLAAPTPDQLEPSVDTPYPLYDGLSNQGRPSAPDNNQG